MAIAVKLVFVSVVAPSRWKHLNQENVTTSRHRYEDLASPFRLSEVNHLYSILQIGRY